MCPSRRWPTGAVTTALALLVVVTGAVQAPVAAQTATPTAQPETDNTATQVTVYPNGSARWTIHVRSRLDNNEEVAQYQAFQTRFRANRSAHLEPFSRRMERVVAGAANATGREMAAEGFEASTRIQEIPRRWGIVTFEFTWVGFAERSDGRLVVGDVFEGGFFLAENDTLSVSAPAGYAVVETVPPAATQGERTVTWVGRVDFADRQPLLQMAPEADGAAQDRTPQRSERRETTPPGADGGAALRGWVPVAGVAIVIVAVIAAGGYAVRRRRMGGTGGAGATEPASAGSRLVTDADRVRRLLEENGGRMRQADVADDLGWSTSKTSRVLSSMAEAGTVQKLRLGRENVIDLQEDEE